MRRRNGIRRLQEGMVGGRAAVARLEPETRRRYRDLARHLYDAGTSAGRAEQFIAKRTEGFVYIIDHPSWPGYVKIGRACDPHSRLNSFQTACPHRQFQLREAVYFADCHFAEIEMHTRMEDVRRSGEWFALPVMEAREILYKLREVI
ncbi:GIY-YIG nuclease family protein [Microbulbifer discodermiae]|uniref:GIY-YIG nuclease family protein n=1 Tax=Microbulbifer sp. 2201CG32-9 TaxID=3232309 RepID=UPI00345C3C4B